MEEAQDVNEKFYTPVECDSFKRFLSEVDGKINQGWIFRGCEDASWSLEHSLERTCDRFNVFGDDRIRVENGMIREFKRRLHQYTANIPSEDASDEWFALMQHHGAPTRLLDFTYSPYVSGYFAFERAKANTPVAIWAVESGWFSNQLKHISKKLDIEYRQYTESREHYGQNFDYIFRSEKPKKLLLTINPFRLNERLAYQRGVFLCPGDVSVSLVENLSTYGNLKELANHIVKYTIRTGPDNKETIETLTYLDTMNISRITLFPGLDGFAQSFAPRTRSLFFKQYHPREPKSR